MDQLYDTEPGQPRVPLRATPEGYLIVQIAGGGGGGGSSVTNLTTTVSPTNVVVASDTGTDATIPLADVTNAGVMPPAAVTQLAGLGTASEADVEDFAPAGHTHALLMTTNERTKLGALPAAADLTTSLAGKMANTLPAMQTVFNGGTAPEKAAFQASVSGDLKSDFVYDPATQPDGSISITGFVYQQYGSASSPAPLRVESGKIVHTVYPAAQSAGYLQVTMPRKVTRIGALIEWPTNAVGTGVLVLPVSNWGPGSVTGSAMHLTIFGNGQWSLIRISVPGGVFTSTTLASHTTHGRFASMWGQGLKPYEVLLDGVGGCVMLWPDGTRSEVTNAFIASEVTSIAMWELFEAAGSEVPAKFGRIWASGGNVSYGGVYADPISIARMRPFAPVISNVMGTIAIDPSASDVFELTLVGNVTTVYFTQHKLSRRLITLHLIQDATGGRTVAGWTAPIKIAGNAFTPTATAAKRDIITFLMDGRENIFEVSRAQNV